jgi:NAD(P)-dependent dehydrogenase (short-subunit alcohol dehydrogenase family)
MLLDGKVAVIYGGGAISEAVASAFTREGAKVFLAGRNQQRLAQAAQKVKEAGGSVETAQLDAMDEQAVAAHAAAVVATAGSLDISINLISITDVQGTPLADMSPADVESPVVTVLRSTFLTAKAAARHMKQQGSGVILMFGGYGDPPRGHHIGGLQVAFQAADALRRNLAAELGPDGIRVVTLQTAGIVDTLPADFEGREELAAEFANRAMLGRAATLADVGNVACFAASDWARTLTATAINMTCGAQPD